MRRGLHNGRGSRSNFIPTKEGGGADNVLAMLKGGHNKFCSSLNRGIEVLAILKGGGHTFSTHEKGEGTFYPVLRGRHQMFLTHNFFIL